MADQPEREVLSGLPRTRPARRSARRGPAEPAPRREPPPPAGWATPDEADGDGFGPVEAATTAVRAVGELTAIGLAIARQGVRGLLGRRAGGR